MTTKFKNISVDSTMGGLNPSDETVSSQKAIKSYVDIEAAKKLNTTSSIGIIYGTDNSGQQTTYSYNTVLGVSDIQIDGTSVVSDHVADLSDLSGVTIREWGANE